MGGGGWGGQRAAWGAKPKCRVLAAGARVASTLAGPCGARAGCVQCQPATVPHSPGANVAHVQGACCRGHLRPGARCCGRCKRRLWQVARAPIGPAAPREQPVAGRARCGARGSGQRSYQRHPRACTGLRNQTLGALQIHAEFCNCSRSRAARQAMGHRGRAGRREGAGFPLKPPLRPAFGPVRLPCSWPPWIPGRAAWVPKKRSSSAA